MARPLTTLDLSLTTSRWSAVWDPTITPPTYPSTLPRSSPNVCSPQRRGTCQANEAASYTENAEAGPSRIPLGDITPVKHTGSGSDRSDDSASSVGAFTQEQHREQHREPEELELELENLEDKNHGDITGIEDITDTQWAEAEEDRRKRKSSQASGSGGSGGSGNDHDLLRAPRASSRGMELDGGSSPRVRKPVRRSRGSRIDVSSSAVDHDGDMASPSLQGASADAQRRNGSTSTSKEIRPPSPSPQTPHELSAGVMEADWSPSPISPRTRARRDGHGVRKSTFSPEAKDDKTPGLEDLFNSPPAKKRRRRQTFVLSSDEEDGDGGGGGISTTPRRNDQDRTRHNDQDQRKAIYQGKSRASDLNDDNPASSSGARKRKDTSGLSSSRKTIRNDNDDDDDDVVPQEVLDEDEYDLPLGDLVDLDIDFAPSRSVNALGSASAYRSGPSRRLADLANPTSIPSTSLNHSSILDALDLNLRTAPITSHIPTPTSHLPPARASTTTSGLTMVSPTSLRMRLDQPVMFISDMEERDKEFYLNHWRRGADNGGAEVGRQAGWDLVEEDEDDEEAGERDGRGKARAGTRAAGPARRGKGASKRGGAGRSRGGGAKFFRGRARGGWRGKAGARRK